MHHLNAGFAPEAIFCDQRLRSGESGFDVLRALLARCPGASAAMVSDEINSPKLQDAQDEAYRVLRMPQNTPSSVPSKAQGLAATSTVPFMVGCRPQI